MCAPSCFVGQLCTALINWLIVTMTLSHLNTVFSMHLPVRQRYPADRDPRAGPVQLAAIAASSGWIADNATWKSGLTKICPAEEFRGDLATSSWLPSEDLAFIYRAFATYDNPLKIVSPEPLDRGRRVYEPGTPLRIVVDDSKFGGCTRLECFDGASASHNCAARRPGSRPVRSNPVIMGCRSSGRTRRDRSAAQVRCWSLFAHRADGVRPRAAAFAVDANIGGGREQAGRRALVARCVRRSYCRT